MSDRLPTVTYRIEETPYFETLPDGSIMSGVFRRKVLVTPETDPADASPPAEALTDAP